jgi:hypothetical protein
MKIEFKKGLTIELDFCSVVKQGALHKGKNK